MVGRIGIWLPSTPDDKSLDGQLMPGLEPNGVPRGLTGTSIPFEFNNIKKLKNKLKAKNQR